MLDEVRGMVVFARVVESGSFAEAARRLNVSRAAVSSQIKQLEDRLGVRLLHRSTRSLSMTDAGRSYYKSCVLIAEEAIFADQKVRNLTDEPTGRISVTCSTNFGLKRIVPLLSEFRKQNPKVELDIVLSDDVVNLIDGGFDLAIRAGPLSNSDMIARKLCSTDRFICASQEYLNQYGTPMFPEDLSSHHWVTYSRQAKYVEVEKDGRKYRLKIEGPVHTNNAGARLKLVVEGHGLGLLPSNEVREYSSRNLVQLFPDYRLPGLDVFAVYPSGATTTVKVRMLIDFLIQKLQN